MAFEHANYTTFLFQREVHEKNLRAVRIFVRVCRKMMEHGKLNFFIAIVEKKEKKKLNGLSVLVVVF